MPFQSEAQRRFMWANHPSIAEKWSHGEHTTSNRRFKPKNKGLPYHKRTAKRKSHRSRSRKRSR